MEERDQLRFLLHQLADEQISEQVVQAIWAADVARGDDEIGPREPLQRQVGAFLSQHRVAQGPAELVEDRGPAQEAGVPRTQVREQFGPHVVGEVAVAAPERALAGLRRAVPQRKRREIERGRPAFAGRDQVDRLLLRQLGVRRLEEQTRLTAAQREVGGSDLTHETARA